MDLAQSKLYLHQCCVLIGIVLQKITFDESDKLVQWYCGSACGITKHGLLISNPDWLKRKRPVAK